MLTYAYPSIMLRKSIPGKTAVVDGLTNKRISFEELDLNANRLCNALLDLGLKKAIM